jgi:CheY-like chemotaxis protein
VHLGNGFYWWRITPSTSGLLVRFWEGGYLVDLAVNGKEAVELTALYDFDIISMDCQIPIRDGLEATRRIRQREAKRGLKRLPIIATAANALDGDKDMCLAAGTDDYL